MARTSQSKPSSKAKANSKAKRRAGTLAAQFKITLQEIDPPVWRRIRVPAYYSFWDLHVAIQDAMGWTDSHLHAFRLTHPKVGARVEIGIPDEEFDTGNPVLPGWEVPLAAYFEKPGFRAEYEYDFGDSWVHEVLLEEVVDPMPGQVFPQCLGGAGACPPEDCGGPPGYEQLLIALADPSHEEHESMMEWVGGRFDPTAFAPSHVTFDDPEERWIFAFGTKTKNR